MGLLLAVASAGAFGVADFLGGLASRRIDPLRVVIVVEVTGLAALAAVGWWLVPASSTGASDLLWGGAAGIAGALALVAFYRALATGDMTIVAPTSALVAAVVPIGFGLIVGERPGAVATMGVVAALGAIVLVTREPGSAATTGTIAAVLSRPGIGGAFAAGLGFGLFFILITRSGDGSGIIPVLGARIGGTTVLAAIAMATGRTVSWRTDTTRPVIGAGILDVAANVLFLAASRRELLTLTSVLAGLYPAATILLARFVLHERVQRHQWAGVGLALVALALISAG